MARMSALHNPTSLTVGASIGAISTAANVLNGATVDFQGKRGVLFLLNVGVTTGTANVAAWVQTNDLPTDPDNGNWTNVNTTTYPLAAVAAQTNDNTAYAMMYDASWGTTYAVRAVRETAANTAVAAITHVVY